jgi:hypothetical protein
VFAVRKQSGSPIRFRTSNPVVYSPGVKCFVFSGHISTQAVFRGHGKPCSGAQNGGLFTAHQLCVALHISAAATRNACLSVAAVVAAALGNVNDLRSCLYAPFARLQLLHYLRWVTVRRGEHLANRVRDGCSWVPRNQFFLRLLFRVELCGSDGNDFGVLEHARS